MAATPSSHFASSLSCKISVRNSEILCKRSRTVIARTTGIQEEPLTSTWEARQCTAWGSPGSFCSVLGSVPTIALRTRSIRSSNQRKFVPSPTSLSPTSSSFSRILSSSRKLFRVVRRVVHRGGLSTMACQTLVNSHCRPGLHPPIL